MTKPPTARTRQHTPAKGFVATSGVLLLATLTCGTLAATASSASPNHAARIQATHAARTLSATDTAKLHYIPPAHGSQLDEEGAATGTLPGRMQAHVEIGPNTTGSFTIYVRGGGTIKGHGTATMHGSGIYESFSGTLVVTEGSGRYAHAHGRAGLYGTFDRKTYALLVQTTGRLAY
jgi:hypothetical protein